MKSKLLAFIICVIALLNSYSSVAFASDIQSESSTPIGENHKYDLGNGIGFELTEWEDENSLSQKISPLATVSTLTKSKEGRFYILSSGDTIARFKLTAKFNYDGTMASVNVLGCSATVWDTAENWRLEKSWTYSQISDSYCSVTGEYTLQYNGSYNNDCTIDIYCNQKGVITIVFDGDKVV